MQISYNSWVYSLCYFFKELKGSIYLMVFNKEEMKEQLNGLARESRHPRFQLGALRSPHGWNNIKSSHDQIKSSHGRIGDGPDRPNI